MEADFSPLNSLPCSKNTEENIKPKVLEWQKKIQAKKN